MSEYQYYEFRTVDRPLTRAEMDELRAISSRAEITSTSFTNEYNYGDFRGDAIGILARYFDAFLYVANWGTHRVAFRLPLGAIDVEAFEAYCDGEQVALHIKGPYAIIDITYNEEGGWGWEEGEGYLDELMPLREELLAGDLRPLYLAWLSQAGGLWEDEAEEEVEPPVPPGMQKLSAAQQALVEFLYIDPDLLAAAVEGASGSAAAPQGPTREELSAWVSRQPAAQKDGWLVALLEGEQAVRSEVLRAFRGDWAKARPAPSAQEGRRTVAALEARARVLQEKRKQREQAASERKRRKEEEEAARRRAAYLDTLAGKEAELWRKVEEQVALKQARAYDQAVEWLRDLRDLAERAGTSADFQTRIAGLRQAHARKPTFILRLDNAGLRP